MGLSLNGVSAGSWQLQEEVNPLAFATEGQRAAKVRQWEAAMARYVVVDQFKIEERTEHKFCAYGVACDLFVARHRYIAPNETYAIFKFAVMEDSFVPPDAVEDRRSKSKLELNSYCKRHSLGYSLYTPDPLPVSSWKNSSVVGALTRQPVLDSTKDLKPSTTFYQVSY